MFFVPATRVANKVLKAETRALNGGGGGGRGGGKGKIVRSKKVRYHIRQAAKFKVEMERRAERHAADDEAGRQGAWIRRAAGAPGFNANPGPGYQMFGYQMDRQYAVDQTRRRCLTLCSVESAPPKTRPLLPTTQPPHLCYTPPNPR